MNKTSYMLAGAVLVAIAGAYFLGRADHPGSIADGGGDLPDRGVATDPVAPATGAPKPEAWPTAVANSAPLPALGTPLKDTFAKLQARANAGDAAAASRLLRDLSRCRQLRDAEWKSADTANDLTSHDTKGMSPGQLGTYQALLDAMEIRQQAIKRDQTMCAGVDDAMLGTLTANMALAAKLGDPDARSCYLDRGPLYDTGNLLDHPEALRNYRGNASAMVTAGLAEGDWRTVDLLQKAYEPGAQGLLAAMLKADPVQHYRYLKLYRLGAEPHRAARLDQQLAVAASSLTSAQLAEADGWAQDNLRERFQGASTATTPDGWDTCVF